MSENNNDNKITHAINRSTDSLDKGAIGNSLNSDNAFNDSGLENARKLNNAMRRENSE